MQTHSKWTKGNYRLKTDRHGNRVRYLKVRGPNGKAKIENALASTLVNGKPSIVRAYGFKFTIERDHG